MAGRRALLIVNPAAGKRTAHEGDLAECVNLLTAAGLSLERCETGVAGSTSAQLAASAKRDRFDSVIVAGGDGTVAPAAIELLNTDLVLGILPFGSWMNIANGLGIPLAPIDAARVIVAGNTKRCDAGEVAEKIFFETCGIGLDADAFGAMRHLERRRWSWALKRMARWATARPRAVEIVVDGEATRHEALQILVVNSPYYGWAFPLVPDADMTDGLLEVAVFPRMGRRDLVRSLAEIWLRGRPGTAPHIRRGKVIEIRSGSRLPVHADGQIAGSLPITVHCRAGALRVFA